MILNIPIESWEQFYEACQSSNKQILFIIYYYFE